MPTQVHWLKLHSTRSRIAIMARPRGNEWLEEELISLKRMQISTLVSLLQPSEIDELGLHEEQQLSENYGISFINFPIADRGVPGSKIEFTNLIDRLGQDAKADKNLVIHCRMGIGRSSMVAAAVLIRLGAD